MKMRAVLALMALVMLLAACGGGADAGPKATMEKVAVVMENLANSMEKADSAASVAAALNAYTDAMEKLIPEMKAVNEKHPELKTMGKEGGEIPAEYKEVVDRMTKAGEKMGTSMMKLGQFYADEAVQAAQKRFTEVMAKMN